MQPMQQLASGSPLMLAFETQVLSSIRRVQKPAEIIEEDSTGDLVQTSPVDQVCGIMLSTTLEARPKARRRIQRRASPKDQTSMPSAPDTEKLTKAADMKSEVKEAAISPVTTKGWDSTSTSHVSTSAGTTSANADTDEEVATKSVNSRVEKVMTKKAMRKARKLNVLESGPSSAPMREQSLPQVGIEEEGKVTVELPSLPEFVADGGLGVQHSRMVGEASLALAIEGKDAEPSAERVPAEQLAAVIGGELPLTEARGALQEGELQAREPYECADKCRIDSGTSDLNFHGNQNRLMHSIDSEELQEGEEEELKELAKLLDDLTSDNDSDHYDEHKKHTQFASESETQEPGASEKVSSPWKWERDLGNSKACWDPSWKVDPKNYQNDWMKPFDKIFAMKGNDAEQVAERKNVKLFAQSVPADQLAAVISGKRFITKASAKGRKCEKDHYDEREKDAEYTSELPQTAEPRASVRASCPWKWEYDDGEDKAWKVDPKDYQDDWMMSFDQSLSAGPQVALQPGWGHSPCALEVTACNNDWERVRSVMHKLMCVDVDDTPMNTAMAVAQSRVAHSQDAKVAGSGVDPEAKAEEVMEVYPRLTAEALAEHEKRYADGHYKYLRIDG